jgi:hypothetical protein
MILAIHLHLVLRLRMSATIPLLLPHTSMAWTGTMLPLAYTTHAAKKQPILYGSSATRIYCSVTEHGSGATRIYCSVTERGSGATRIYCSVTEHGSGATRIYCSVTERGSGATRIYCSVTERGSGATRIYCSVTEQIELFMNTVLLSSQM